MRGIANTDRTAKIQKAWLTGRYKSFSSLARALHTYPKAVERAVKDLSDNANGHKKAGG